MSALQIHRISCPQDPEFRDRLHTHLWKQFPMDGFRFQEPKDESDLTYEGTQIAPLAGTVEEDAVDDRREVYLDEVEKAVSEFVAEAEIAA